MSERLLFISNGHGEDDNSSHVIRTLRAIRPTLDISALAIVGEGNAYRKLDIPLVGPTYTLPSGGFTYMNRLLLINDIKAGLLTKSWQQFQAMKTAARNMDLIVATGDTIPQAFAYFSKKPFVANIAPLSAMYEGTLKLDILLWPIFRSARCRAVATRDTYTAKDLKQQGLDKVCFGGMPSADRIQPTGKELSLEGSETETSANMVALLPGSRTAEALRNFKVEMQLAQEVAQLDSNIPFRAALVPSVMAEVKQIASELGWQSEAMYTDHQSPWIKLSHTGNEQTPQSVEIFCYQDAYSDIVRRSKLVVGMAGLAIEQAVAIGKPIIQIPGDGPQFTYAFAEAQNRLHGLSIQTIGTAAATADTIKEAAQRVVSTLDDSNYLQSCVENGFKKFGPLGGSARIANLILKHLDEAKRDKATDDGEL